MKFARLETIISWQNFRRVPNFIYKNIIIADIHKIRYNIGVVLPIPGNGRRCSYGNHCFFYYRCHGWCGQPPHQQMVRQQRYRGQQIAWQVLCHHKRKEESPTVRAYGWGFRSLSLWTHCFFLPMAIIAYAALIFNMYFLLINRLCMLFHVLNVK